jgi:putative sigma-54 modulation protein
MNNTNSPVVPDSISFIINQPTSEALSDHIKARLGAALNQHADHVSQVSVRIDDQNGPKGGEDLQARIAVSFKHQPTLLFQETGSDAYKLISVIADRVKQTVGRQMGRQADRRKTAS